MTQCEKCLNVLENNRGKWIKSDYFLYTLHLSQFHARLLELEEKGYPIEHSTFKDDFGYVSYRLPFNEPTQQNIWQKH